MNHSAPTAFNKHTYHVHPPPQAIVSDYVTARGAHDTTTHKPWHFSRTPTRCRKQLLLGIRLLRSKEDTCSSPISPKYRHAGIRWHRDCAAHDAPPYLNQCTPRPPAHAAPSCSDPSLPSRPTVSLQVFHVLTELLPAESVTFAQIPSTARAQRA